MTAPRLLVVFDFDWSFIDQDSDHYLLEVLSPGIRHRMEQEAPAKMWTDLYAECLSALHEEGRAPEEILATLRSIPFHPAMKRAVKSLKARPSPKTTFFLLSNANALFIETILQHNDLGDHFHKIVTNPAEFLSGKLELRRRVDPTGPQHACQVPCDPNMCKGEELDAYIESQGGWDSFDRVVYVGDGSNDLCPVLRLRKQDLVCARTPRALSRLLKSRGLQMGLKCSVEEWSQAWELERIFNKFDGKVHW